MKSLAFKKQLWLTILPISFGLTLILNAPKPVLAQGCNEYMGTASTGAAIQLDTCSINPVSYRSVNFTYYLGQMKINAQAHCDNGTWTTFHDQVIHSPQSQATAQMIDSVCGYGGQNNLETAFVPKPPSNVRLTPNGTILCTLTSRMTINIYGNQGEWFYTDACGSMGLIHSSQLQF